MVSWFPLTPVVAMTFLFVEMSDNPDRQRLLVQSAAGGGIFDVLSDDEATALPEPSGMTSEGPRASSRHAGRSAADYLAADEAQGPQRCAGISRFCHSFGGQEFTSGLPSPAWP